jgi:hypothetical protein
VLCVLGLRTPRTNVFWVVGALVQLKKVTLELTPGTKSRKVFFFDRLLDCHQFCTCQSNLEEEALI